MRPRSLSPRVISLAARPCTDDFASALAGARQVLNGSYFQIFYTWQKSIRAALKEEKVQRDGHVAKKESWLQEDYENLVGCVFISSSSSSSSFSSASPCPSSSSCSSPRTSPT